MDPNQVNFWLSTNAQMFAPETLPAIRSRLEQMNDQQMMYLSSASFHNPSNMLLIAIFLGWERFFLDDIALGVVKVLTGYGCLIWGLIDMFTAKSRTQKYNLEQFEKATGMMTFASAPYAPPAPPAPAAPYYQGYNQQQSYQAPNYNPAPAPQAPQNYYGQQPAYYMQQPGNSMPGLSDRIKKLLVSPQREYEAIDRQNPSHTDVLGKHVILLALIPFLFAFIGGAILYSGLWSFHFGTALWGATRLALYQVLVMVGGIYFTSLLINSFSNTFGGLNDFNRAFALVAYAYVPMCIAGIFNIWSGFAWLAYPVGAYGLYLLVAGLKPMMRPADEKADSYSAVSSLVAIAVFVILLKLLGLIMIPKEISVVEKAKDILSPLNYYW